MKLRVAITAVAITATLGASIARGESTPEETIASLTREKTELLEQLKALQGCSITSSDLAHKSTARLKEIASHVRQQRQGMVEFEGYVKWMSGHIAGYSKYLAAGSAAAGFAKILPIPYAGQASLFTKFVSNAAISLSSTSVAINKYLATSQRFLAGVDALDPAKGTNGAQVNELVRMADRDLLTTMVEVQERLNSTSELSTSTLSFLESLNHYVGSTDEYWAKTKSLLKGDEKKEKSFLAENIAALRNKAQGFNGKLKTFGDTVQKDTPLIKSLVAYDELIHDLEPKVAKAK